jgi:hypothetical protein
MKREFGTPLARRRRMGAHSMTDSRGVQDFGGGPEQEFSFSYDGRELRCFSTSPAHGEPQWAVTIGNRTFGTGLPASVHDRIESVQAAVVDWYEFEKARGTFGP